MRGGLDKDYVVSFDEETGWQKAAPAELLEVARLLNEGKTHSETHKETGISMGQISNLRQKIAKRGLLKLNAKAQQAGQK
jgi:hypothetical protein